MKCEICNNGEQAFEYEFKDTKKRIETLRICRKCLTMLQEEETKLNRKRHIKELRYTK